MLYLQWLADAMRCDAMRCDAMRCWPGSLQSLIIHSELHNSGDD